jgi:hypothetical protein
MNNEYMDIEKTTDDFIRTFLPTMVRRYEIEEISPKEWFEATVQAAFALSAIDKISPLNKDGKDIEREISRRVKNYFGRG